MWSPNIAVKYDDRAAKTFFFLYEINRIILKIQQTMLSFDSEAQQFCEQCVPSETLPTITLIQITPIHANDSKTHVISEHRRR